MHYWDGFGVDGTKALWHYGNKVENFNVCLILTTHCIVWPSRRLIYFLFSFPGILWFWNSSTCSYSFVVEVMSWLSRVNHLLCGMYWLTTDIVSLRKLIMSRVGLLTDCLQSVFLLKLSVEWGKMSLLFSSIPLFCVRRSLHTRLSDPKRKCRLPSLSSLSPKRTYVNGALGLFL